MGTHCPLEAEDRLAGQTTDRFAIVASITPLRSQVYHQVWAKLVQTGPYDFSWHLAPVVTLACIRGYFDLHPVPALSGTFTLVHISDIAPADSFRSLLTVLPRKASTQT